MAKNKNKSKNKKKSGLEPHRSGLNLYIDGASGPKKINRKRPPRSGWGISVWQDGLEIYEACGVVEPQVTCNAIELEALIQCLGFLNQQPMQVRPATIWTDSRYVMDSISRIAKQFDTDLLLETGKQIKNKNRIRAVYDFLFILQIGEWTSIRWTKGHSGTEGNEKADYLSKQAAYKGEEYYNFKKR